MLQEISQLRRLARGQVGEQEILGRSGGVTHSQANDPLALWQHDQLRARDRFMDVATPTGSAEVYKPPFNISDTGPAAPTVPALGQDTTNLAARLIARATPPKP